MGSISEFGKSQDANKLADALRHLTQRLNPPCRLSTQSAPALWFHSRSESSSLALTLRDFKATPILPSPIFFHLARQHFHLATTPPRSPIAPYNEAHVSH
ncbi:hypothetical protein N7471_003060 [Penicillium samsonianum]|uniref:uncharacterized protein n=1 Tax=Penicillium samsonianum TaxID=1882272 RepID=UPI00254848A4|nr:uncharacterized protein N7471_003060 [Penicillium samsonianum]KAJ6143607.1 hypothetical protein N7471_003060 [Penicillium samsonianum]